LKYKPQQTKIKKLSKQQLILIRKILIDKNDNPESFSSHLKFHHVIEHHWGKSNGEPGT